METMESTKFPPGSAASNLTGAARLLSLLAGALFALVPAALAAQADRAPDPLESHEYGLWEGSWSNPSTSEVYERLSITDAGANGFMYSFECRYMPYGPNSESTNEAIATFLGPFNAQDEVSGQSFSLTVDPDNRHVRIIETGERSYSFCSSSGHQFEFRRTTFRAGFDCDQAATAVEVAICGNELIALGDWEMTEAYRALRAASSTVDREALLASQRAWLSHRNQACLGGNDAVDETCLAHLYSDRLVELARAGDPGLGTGPRFDAAYAMGLLNRGDDLGEDAAMRLAMYPLSVGTATWRADDEGVLFESTHVEEDIVWPGTVEFRHSQMLFVGSDGTVWIAKHVEPLLELGHGLNRYQLWSATGGDPFTIRSETGIDLTEPPSTADDVPDLVRDWLARHPITDIMRDVP